MKAEMRRRVLVISVITVVALGLGYGFLPKPVSVDVVPALRGLVGCRLEENVLHN